MKLKITFQDGTQKTYKSKQFTDYTYDRKCFVVIKKKQWIGIYNLDCIESIEVQ